MTEELDLDTTEITAENVGLFEEKLNDPRWRISNLYKIVDKKGRKVRFKPNADQLDFLTNMHTRNVILKCRQRGFTTLCCIIYLDDCLFNSNVSAAVIAHKLDDAAVIFRDKVKSVYHDLPEAIKKRVPLTQESQTTLSFANGSTIRVSTSARSGTVQWLHISEYGKICAQYPEKAREIRTGSFPAAEQGCITIESTAEGNFGDFYEKCSTAMNDMAAIEAANATGEHLSLSRLDFKFFFYPWWKAPEYRARQVTVPQSREDEIYFNTLENDLHIELTEEQRNWWLAQERDLLGDMKREYPATPQEAFEQSVEGAYFADQIALAYKHGKIGEFPVDPSYPVNTSWDLGRNDRNTIWLWQDIDAVSRFVGYYHNSGEFIGHYIKWLNDWAADHEVVFGDHYLPHDGDVESLWLEGGTMDVMGKLKFYPNIVKRTSDKILVINAGRKKFSQCQWDAKGCKEGLDLLKRYRKEFDEKSQVFRNTPVHDEASHTADGWLTFVQSNHQPRMYQGATRNGKSLVPQVKSRYAGLKSRGKAQPRTFMGV